MAKPRIIYWDSATFLALFNKDKSPRECELCEDVWSACKKGSMLMITSTLTVAEVIHLKGTPKLDPKNRELVSNFFRDDHIVIEPVTRKIAEMARDVVWDNSIKPKDAIHVATALFHKAVALHTFDKGLTHIGNIDFNGFALRMCEPHAQKQTVMNL